MLNVEIHTDGVCPGGSGLGGWGAVMICGKHVRELSGAEQGSTVNRMELVACIEALKALKQPCNVHFYSDSKYAIDGATQWLESWKSRGWRAKGGWKKSSDSIKNEDLWKQLDELLENHDVRWTWVRSESTAENRQAGALALKGQEALLSEMNAVRDAAAQDEDKARQASKPVLSGNARQVTIYTDGSCLKNPGPGGWAAIIQGGGIVTEISGGFDNTTNNRMELIAALEGIESTDAKVIRIVTDSKYVVQGIEEWLPTWVSNNWKTKNGGPVKNADLWRRMKMAITGVEIHLQWVKGHAGHEMNERADKLARAEAEKVKRGLASMVEPIKSV